MSKTTVRRRRLPTHADIIRLWESVPVFAQDIGVKVEAARKMVARSAVSEDHWAPIEQAARRRRIRTRDGESVTVELLAEIRAAERRRRQRRRPQK